MTKRIQYFDIARGIGIICVVLSHTLLDSQRIDGLSFGVAATWIFRICFSFHMPLFFILSGYFMRPNRKFRWRKESDELLATYALSSVAVIILNAIREGINHRSVLDGIRKWVVAAFYGSGAGFSNGTWEVKYPIGATWFLLALFWAHLIISLADKTPMPWMIILISFLVGYTLGQHIWLPFSLLSGMSASLFVYIGRMIRQADSVTKLQSKSISSLIMWILLILVWFIAIIRFDEFGLATNRLGGHPAWSIAGAIAGTMTVVGISILIDYVPKVSEVLSLIGRGSLALLCIHMVEMNVFPWARMITALDVMFGHRMLWMMFFAIRLIMDLILVICLYHIPVVNAIFFPSLQKKLNEPSRSK